MTRSKHDRLLAALIAKLPAAADPPEADHWPRAGRIAWLQMMAMAFDVVYGACGGIRVASGESCGDDGGMPGALTAPASREEAGHGAATQPAPRFYVDRDGFAMGDGRPIAMADLPAGAILWDERTGVECGDAGAILWRGAGTSRERLPPGVVLRPVFDET
jgi:hypothetical protein